MTDKFVPNGSMEANLKDLFEPFLSQPGSDTVGFDADELFWTRGTTKWELNFGCQPTTWGATRMLTNGVVLKCIVQGRNYAYKGGTRHRPISWTAYLRWCDVTVTHGSGSCTSLMHAARQILALPIDYGKLGRAFYQKKNAVCVYRKMPETSWSRLSLHGPYEPFATWFGHWFEHLPVGEYRIVFNNGHQTNMKVGWGNRSSGYMKDDIECPNWYTETEEE